MGNVVRTHRLDVRVWR